MLHLLPPPPPGKTGWPWTEESDPLPPFRPDGGFWPSISIITPSFNQGQFIEETIRSILLQNYPNLEYIIIDGGSTDETISILNKYADLINYWVSEPDNGQSQAINKGFSRCNGEFINWICSDDILCKNALKNVGPVLISGKDILLLGKGYRIDRNSQIIDEIQSSAINSFEQLVDLGNFWRRGNSILQQSTLFSANLAKQTGLLNESNYYTMDYELWCKLMMSKISVVRTNIAIGMFRWYDGQKTSFQKNVTKSLIKTARQLIIENPHSGRSSRIIQLAKIIKYRISYSYSQFRSYLGVKRRIRKLFHA